MSDQNGKPVISPEQITEFFKKEFVFTDNIPEDMNRRRAIVMEARASILIDAHCTSGRFPTFMKAGRHIEGGWEYELPEDVEFPFDDAGKKYVICLNKFKIIWNNVNNDNGIPGKKWQPEITSTRWQLDGMDNGSIKRNANGVLEHDSIENVNKKILSDKLKNSEQVLVSAFGSKFGLCKHISPYNTPEKACRFFGNLPFPFAPLKLNNSAFRLDIFHDQAKAANKYLADFIKNADDKCSEEISIQQCLSEAVEKSQEQFIVSGIYSKRYQNWLKMVYTFKNEYGEPIMKVAKLYDTESQTKSLIPMTMWMRNNSITDQLFCVPLPEDKQPLYNLDQLKADELSPVILTDSIELADANEMEGVIFTSFICDPGQYDQVDWSPLLNRTVYYLVTNHSGSLLEREPALLLASAYLKAKTLAEYLEEKEDIVLKFIQMKVNYSVTRHYASIDDILTHYRDKKPAFNAESVRIFEDEESFELQYQKAVEAINTKPLEWWEENSKNTEDLRIVKDEIEKRKIIDYVLHPILIRGEATMIYAKKSTGKSAFALSLAALATSSFTLGPKRILDEKWWSIPKKLNKVLYLDFENKEKTLDERYKYFIYPQWPKDKADRAKCYENLIIDDMTKREHLDYSEPANHQKIIDLIEEAKAKGIAGQPVDLLVIDTYTKFVNNEDPQTSDNFSDFLNKIRGRNIAILIVHHSTEEGLPRGYKKMLDDLYFNIRLYREDDEPHDLTVPLKVKYVSFRSSLPATMWKEFEITCVNGKWNVDEPTMNENEELEDIVKAYHARDYKNEEIWKMIGIKSSAFYDRVKK